MDAIGSQPSIPPRKRHWYQFSLRRLLALILLASIGMSWFAVKMQKARRQREAIDALRQTEAIDASGESTVAWVWYDCDWDHECGLEDVAMRGPGSLRRLLGDDFFNDVVRVNLTATTADDSTLTHLEAFPRLRSLLLDETQITDCGLEHLAPLGCLEHLSLRRLPITNDGLAHVALMVNLKVLDLSGTRITDDGLLHLRRLTRLEGLRLWGTGITDDGLLHLMGLTNLGDLALGDTRVTDAGLEHLTCLTNLKSVMLPSSGPGSRITHQGVDRLSRALPQCEIIR